MHEEPEVCHAGLSDWPYYHACTCICACSCICTLHVSMDVCTYVAIRSIRVDGRE